jgi:hypothetical protein
MRRVMSTATLELIWFIDKMNPPFVAKRSRSGYLKKPRLVLLAVFLLTLFSTTFNSPSLATNQIILKNKMDDNFPLALASQNVGGNFRPSLEMMEAVDYLLTPAFIIKDALDDSVVPTYPSQ